MAVAGASRVATVTKQAAGGLEVQVALGIDGSGSVEWCARSLREISLKMRCTRAAFRLQALVHLLSNSSSEPTSIRIAATHLTRANVTRENPLGSRRCGSRDGRGLGVSHLNPVLSPAAYSVAHNCD
jgi:hypothetical protein